MPTTEEYNTAEIPFTQYLRPDGRKRSVHLPCTDAQARRAQQLIDQGYRFEVEKLTTGEVSVTVFDTHQEVDLTGLIAENAPGIEIPIDRLLDQAEEAVHGR